MLDSSAENPDLNQLRRRAKELRDDARRGDPAALERFAHHHPSFQPGAVSLTAAQLVIARELGFASWPKLKAAVDAEAQSRRAVSEFVAASVEGRMAQARHVLQADPAITERSLTAAAVFGDAELVSDRISANPASAVAIDDERGWPPLLYACYSQWHHVEPVRTSGLAEVVRLLLVAGASPNTNDGGRNRYRSALKGSVEVNNPAVTEILLAAGANPDAGQAIGEAVAHADHRCLELLLAYGARIARTWALGAAVHHDDAEAMRMLLEALRASPGRAANEATETLPDAAANASLAVVGALLDAGADPDARDDDGVSAIRLAVRAGKHDIAARLREVGTTDDSTDVDRFLGACINGDRKEAEQLLADSPDLRDRLTDKDRALIVDAAAGSAEAVGLMLDLGFSPDARKFGEQPLHNAAYYGNAAVVRLLLAAGAEVDARDERFESTPLAFATVGSGEQAGEPGDWITTVQLLIDAGASTVDVWITGKPPSDEVIGLLRSHGIGPEEQPERPGDADIDEPASIGTGAMADIARQLETAYRQGDLELLGSLLHPDVHWTGMCKTRDQVLDWYRGLLADGTTPVVQSVEVDRDAILFGMAVTRQAEGARPAPPQQVFQVFTVDDSLIVDIRGYPDRASALRRPVRSRQA